MYAIVRIPPSSCLLARCDTWYLDRLYLYAWYEYVYDIGTFALATLNFI